MASLPRNGPAPWGSVYAAWQEAQVSPAGAIQSPPGWQESQEACGGISEALWHSVHAGVTAAAWTAVRSGWLAKLISVWQVAQVLPA